MSKPRLEHRSRLAEFERLVGEARALLDRPSEEIVVNYLDHAVEALQIVKAESAETRSEPQVRPVTAQAMAQAEDHG